MTFKIGQIVCCVDASGKRPTPSLVISGDLVEGNYYTIRGNVKDPRDGTEEVYVNEIILKNQPPGQYSHYEIPIRASRFRLMETTTNEITVKQEEKIKQ